MEILDILLLSDSSRPYELIRALVSTDGQQAKNSPVRGRGRKSRAAPLVSDVSCGITGS